MRPIVYLETSVIGHLAGPLVQHAVVAAHQISARSWGDSRRDRFMVVTSDIALVEIRRGDRRSAALREAMVAGVPVLQTTDEATALATLMMRDTGLPPKATADALHVAVATVNGADYLLTLNCQHLANAALRPRIEAACTGAGYAAPVICTPEELMHV